MSLFFMGPSWRVVSPSGGSTLTTSAPRSPSCWPAQGPSTTVVQSTTRTPVSGPGMATHLSPMRSSRAGRSTRLGGVRDPFVQRRCRAAVGTRLANADAMARPIWKGAVSFGLVTIPVGLYAATERRAEIAFRQLHKKDHAPIQYKRVCTAEGVEVAWQDIEKGYEYAKGQFVAITDEDLEKAKVQGSQTIEIREFVPAEQIDFAHFEAPYWLAPEKAGT